MAMISKRKRNEASILTSFSISKRNEPAYSRSCKDRSEANLSKRSELGLLLGKIEVKKMNWMEVKRTEAVFLKLLWSPGIDSKELIPPACALAGLYNNPISARFLAPLDCSKVPAPCWSF
jgi:hypothetical protein